MDHRVHNRIIDCTDRQQYNISKVKHRFQINRYCKLECMQKHTIGCWNRDFDKILLTNSKNNSLIWIYGWTRWATCWQPAQFRRVGSSLMNCVGVDGSGLVITGTANLAMLRFGPGPGPEVKVRNRCWHCSCINLCSYRIHRWGDKWMAVVDLTHCVFSHIVLVHNTR